MMVDYPSDFEQGYNYARRRYKELAEDFGIQALLDLAAALFKITGSDAELARGIAAGIEELVRTGEEGHSRRFAQRRRPIAGRDRGGGTRS